MDKKQIDKIDFIIMKVWRPIKIGLFFVVGLIWMALGVAYFL